MDNEARIAKLKGNEYRKIFGVTKPIFEQMLEILEKAFTFLQEKNQVNLNLVLFLT